MRSTAKLTWLVRHLALISLIFFLNSFAISASATVPNRSAANKPLLAGAVNLQDYGAIGDGSTDAGPALQAALNDLATAGGGTLIVPPGRYLLKTPVLKQFASGTSLIIQGEFSSTPINVAGNGLGLDLNSRFIISVGELSDALTLSGLDSLLVQDVALEGLEPVLNDARVVLKLTHIKVANIKHCEFYGLASLNADGGILVADHCDLKVQETAFLGCSTRSAVGVSVIQNISWLGILVEDSKFIDYGQSSFYSKTPWAPPYSWINIGIPADIDPSWSRREAIVDHVFLDEGAFIAITARPQLFSPFYPPYEVYFSRLDVNVSNLRSAGLYLYGAQRIFIERSHLGWSHNAGPAISLDTVGNTILDLIDTSEDATTLSSLARTLTVINSDFASIFSIPAPAVIINTESPDQDPAQYVRQQYVTVLQRDPDPASHFYWTDRLLRCGTDQACLNQAKNALAIFLAAAPPAKVSASGTVVDENGLPLAGVNLSLTGSQSATLDSDAQGNFAFQRLATGGEYLLTATKNHYSFLRSSFTTPTGDQTRIITGIVLRHTISGHVESSTGEDMLGVTVRLSGSQSATTSTDDKGNFSFPNLPGGGQYEVSVSRANYDFTAHQSFPDLSGDQSCSFKGTLRSYTVSGVVTMSKNGANAGVEGVKISVGGDLSTTTFTDSKGAYSLVLPGDGDYTMAASRVNYQFALKDLTLPNLSGNQTVNFTANPKIPMLLAGSDSTRLLALDAVLRTIEPFDLIYDHDWSDDLRTRIILFATNFELEPNDTNSDFVVEVEDGSHRIYALKVEAASTSRLDDSIIRFVVRFSDDLMDIGDAKLRLAYKGTYSDPLLIAIGHSGN